MRKNNKGYTLVEILLATVICTGIVVIILSATTQSKNFINNQQVQSYHVSHSVIVPHSGLAIRPMFIADTEKLSVTKIEGSCNLAAGDTIESVAQFKQEQGQEATFIYKVKSSHASDNGCGNGTFFAVSTIAGLNANAHSPYFYQGGVPVKLLPYTPTPSAILSEAMLTRAK